MRSHLFVAAILALTCSAGCQEPKPGRVPVPEISHGAATANPDDQKVIPELAPPRPTMNAPSSRPDKTTELAAEAPAPRPAAPPEDLANRKAADAVEACVDNFLAEKNLNPYGDPPDTMYAGGTPLFDESTGRSMDRIDYVLLKHPEVRERCMK